MTHFTAVLSASSLHAARDSGDARTDKGRKQRLLALIKRATLLLEGLPDDVFPDVREAGDGVRRLADLVNKLDMASTSLRNVPNGTPEAVEAQRTVDHLRMSLDSMLLPLEALVESLETLTRHTMQLHQQYEDACQAKKTAEDNLERASARLATVAQAVMNAAKIG